mmetsp:Transcript_2361/g.3202  ORF Transcript_2361/g.3202 Transcript_2361/m.3202 type:complete len:87 (+) Transcript_2361:1875-2135(+)
MRAHKGSEETHTALLQGLIMSQLAVLSKRMLQKYEFFDLSPTGTEKQEHLHSIVYWKSFEDKIYSCPNLGTFLLKSEFERSLQRRN